MRVSDVCGSDGRPVYSPSCKCTVLQEGVTDRGLRALASAGCGEKLMSLDLGCEWFCSCCDLVLWCVGVGVSDVCGCDGHSFSSSILSLSSPRKRAGLKKGVTDSGLRALASTSCGENLVSLTLHGGCLSVPVLSVFTSRPGPSPFSRSGNRTLTCNNFASALGLPEAFHGEELHAVLRLWRMRRAQFLFLREEMDKATAVRLWDEHHEFFALVCPCLHCVSVCFHFLCFSVATARRTRSWTHLCSRGHQMDTRWGRSRLVF